MGAVILGKVRLSITAEPACLMIDGAIIGDYPTDLPQERAYSADCFNNLATVIGGDIGDSLRALAREVLSWRDEDED